MRPFFFLLGGGRAGGVLKVEVWDWDRGLKDDALGHFEVNIGEELLSQQVKKPPKRTHASLY